MCASSLELPGKPRPLEVSAKLPASEIPMLAQRALDDIGGANHQVGVETKQPVVGRHGAMHVRRGELQHPADVGRRDEVPGGAEDVGAEDLSLVDGPVQRRVGGPGRQAEAERPLGRTVLLGLHRSQPGDQLLRTARTGSRDPLVMESLAGDHPVRLIAQAKRLSLPPGRSGRPAPMSRR